MEFRILGPLQVVADGLALELGGPKQRAVLATLVLRANEVVSTDALVGTLWRDDPPRSAVGIVRTYVSRLRRLLDNADTGDETVLVSRPPGYVLDVAPDRIDAHRFELLARQAGRALEAGQYDVASPTLSEALGLWRGDVLADLAGLDALRPTASRLEQLRLAATEDRFEAELALGHHAELVGELEALVELHPFRERLWGQLVVALYRSERQADALAAYQILRSTLVDQVGVEPGPDLQALEHDVLRQAEELRWRPPDQGQRRSGRQPTEPVPEGRLARSDTSRQIPLPPGLARGPHDQPFVGRTRERAVLERSLDAARSGTFNAVFVTGPPGIGKTALAGWLARVAHAAGATVVMGRADEGAGVPFQPFDEAIRHWTLHTEPEDLRRLDDGAAAELSRLAPVLTELRDREEPTRGRTPQAAGGDADRQRLLVAIGGWVEALAARGPAVIVLDDLHWADPAAVVAVRHLVRHPPAAAVLLVVNSRTPARENPELADGLTATAAGGQVVRLELAGLSDGEVLDLLPLAAGAAGEVRPEASRSFAAALARRTGGNPLFVHEMLRHLTERGVLGGGETGNLPSLAFEAFEAFGVPSGVTEVIEQRLRRLPAPTADVLRPGALLGQHIDLAVLSRLVDTSPLAVVEALEPALAVGLVEQDGPRPDRFAFSHALVREAILEGLGPSARIRLHWRAGEAIASLTSSGSTAGGGGARLGEIAHHLAAGVGAGDAQRAIAANVEAGEHALASLAFEDAAVRFTTATELLETAPAADSHLAYDAWLGLGHAAGTLADVERQRDGYLRAAAIARAAGWPGRLARAAIGFATYGAVAGNRTDDRSVAGDLMDEALRGLAELPSVERCLLLALETVHAVTTGQEADAGRMARAAAELAHELDDPTGEAGALLARCWTLVGTPCPHELSEAGDGATALTVLSEAGILVRELLLPLRPVPALQLADRTRFAAIRDRVASPPETRGSVHAAGCVHAWDAAIALCEGRLDDAARLAGSNPGAADGVIWQSVTQFQVTVTWIERGHPAEVAVWLAQHLAVAPDAIAVRAMLALLHAEAGEATRASREVEVLRRQRPFDQLGWSAPIVLRQLAEVAARLDDRGLAADLLPVVTDYSGQLLVSYAGATVEAAADRPIGQLLLVLGRVDEAVERLAAAQALEEAFGAGLLATRTAFWQARARFKRSAAGDHATAGRLLDQAASAARRMGTGQLLRDIEALRPGATS